MRLAFVCSELEGLMKTGGLADATRGLAKALQQAGHQVEVVLPRYGALYQIPVSENWQSLYFQLGHQSFGCAVRHTEIDGIPVALIEHHDFFQRSRPYDDGEHPYPDNLQRFAFFCKAALLYLQQQSSPIDIVHGHDWQSALAACYLKGMRSGALTNSRFMLTVHNAAYQQGFGRDQLGLIGLADWQLPAELPTTLLALGLWQADAVNTVSPGYRDELLSEPAACGLAALYQQHGDNFIGILNGCDYSRWDPATDLHLPYRYHAADLTGKQQCRRELRRQLQLDDDKSPLFVSVSRLTGQKGFSILIPALQQFLAQHPVQVVVMGTGEQQFVQPLQALEQQFPRQFRLLVGFNEPLSHQVEAAGDFFLMPSLFEPCGLNQIYSLCYGTVPLVRATGGLKDTVTDVAAKHGTGICFTEPTAPALLEALERALQLWQNQRRYLATQQRGMAQVFDWQQAAVSYLSWYKQVVKQESSV